LHRAQKAAGDTAAAQQTAAKLKTIWHSADSIPSEAQ
jgi:hypothetical protein